MKNKSTRHKDFNTFKFLPFSERIANIDVDIFHKVGHEYELQFEENNSYFYQTIEKWNVLNLSESYECFRKEIRANNYITLPQVLLSKDHIIAILIKHLKLRNPLCLQPLLEIVVAVAKDLQKEFYDYYPQFLEILIDLLNTKDAEQLEWTFTCLAYLFKLLWRSLVKNINYVFIALLPLLSDNKPEYISNFAAESFAFVTRKGAIGCGKLLFQVINGVDGQFHSSLIHEHVIANIVINIQPQKSELLWLTYIQILENLSQTFKINQDGKIVNNIDLILKLIGQSIEHKGGKILQQPVPLIQQLVKILNDNNLPEYVILTITQIGILLLLSKNIKVPQEQASSLIRKILFLPQKSILLYFVDNVSDYSSFEALILPRFLKHCVANQLNEDCFHILTKLVLKKVPTCGSGIKLSHWNKYPLDFRENNTLITNIMLNHIRSDNMDTIINDFDNYVCSVICLPHLNIKETEESIGNLEKNIVHLLEKINTECIHNENQETIQKILFVFNSTVECLIHLSGTDILAMNFCKIIDSLLYLTTYPQHILSLKIISLCLTALKNNCDIITMENLLKINNALENNFSSPYHEVRLLTSHIYIPFEVLSDFKLRSSADPKVPNEDWKVFSICYNVESIESHVHTYRDQLQNLEKLTFDKPQMVMCNQTRFKTIPLRYLCSTLYMNFQLLWEPVTKIITSHAHGLDINTFWNIYGTELNNVYENIRNPREINVDFVEAKCEFLKILFQENHKLKIRPDFSNYRLLLWKAMSMFPDVAEAKTRNVSELLLNFIELEYTKKKNNEGNINEENDDEDTKTQTPSTSFKPRSKTSIKTLLHKLNVFSQVKSPMSMYREPELYKLYFDLLQHKDSSVQKAALDCIMTYKHKYLTPYKENLYNLVDDKNFKHEITAFQIDKDSNVILSEHRENLIPIVMQIVFSKMSVKTGLRTGGKSSGQMRRNLILRFLAGCQETEMLNFIQKAFRFYTKYLDDDPEVMVNSVLNNVNLEKCIPPKKLQSTINLLNVVLEQFGGLMGNELLSYLLKILLIVGAIIKGALDQLKQIHTGFLSLLRILRTSCIKIVGTFFEHFERYPWNNKQINAIFTVFIWPYINKLNIEGIHSPTTLLKLITLWGSNPRYFPLLVKHEEGKIDQYILPHIIKLLVAEKSHITVVNAIEEMLEKLLSLQPDEEDLQLKLPVDNILPVQEDILDKVGLVDKLNYGSCILLPHVPVILSRIKKKLESKAKKLNQRELFILSRISELVWEADISDTILQLLLPVVLKKCSMSIGEEIILRFLTTILNLIKNVEKPQIHLKNISPLFSEISYSSCRKLLTQILETIAIKSDDDDLKITSHLIAELNAWDAKWLDQPDFERRHSAFKKIQQTISDNNISVSLGILLINNFHFLIKSEKDLSIKENSVHSLKLLCPVLINKYKNEHKQIEYILNDTIFTLIRNGMKNSKEDVRNESISLLGHLARECSDSHFILRDLNRYTNKIDLEVDFFENLVHLQIHRHARALLKFCQVTREQVVAPNPRTLTQFILPLTSYYLCTEKYSSKNSVIDAAIETIGIVCRILPWHQYEGVLKYYLGKLRYKSEYQKQLVRLTVAILDAFHFDLSKAHTDEVEANLKNDVILKDAEHEAEPTHQVDSDPKDDEVDKEIEDSQIDEILDNENFEVDGEDEEVEIDNGDLALKICEKNMMLCKSTATRMVLLPQLHKSLAEMTQHESSHKINRRKTGFEREEEDLLRVPISLAVVKLLQRLPIQILESNLPGVIMKLCTFLKSQLESVRRVTRETLQKIILTLGPKYLGLLLAEMTPLLSRGFQVHVLVYTVHGILNCLKDMYKPTDVDKVLLTVLNLCTADLFGALSEEKEIVKITVKVSEAKSTKSYATLQILAQYITESCLMDLILPIKQVLDSSHSYKIVLKAQESLRYIALGLVDNTFISTESLLKFAYGSASERIPELIPIEKKCLTEKERKASKRKGRLPHYSKNTWKQSGL
ncbi:hypothetical protein NQ314_000480 [Rhamnusium bicolor]|uniref:Small subunit processome component 20 homolog n=1 Tax=Rhamnusium bicolor TaxID=1586634 RepID=A0AAV8ZY11_9CUCU|nr:hypothetical protein NQ314_000480 [Rhamnusium bicolor]